jgi:hypothetical protein
MQVLGRVGVEVQQAGQGPVNGVDLFETDLIANSADPGNILIRQG